jgi:hypothetical protein
VIIFPVSKSKPLPPEHSTLVTLINYEKCCYGYTNFFANEGESILFYVLGNLKTQRNHLATAIGLKLQRIHKETLVYGFELSLKRAITDSKDRTKKKSDKIWT